MSHFPVPSEYSLQLSHTHLKDFSEDSFIIKKAKGVYLYDIDGNKYMDFSLDSGAIFAEHSPPRLTKFIKNALSSGFNSLNHHNKFLYKAQKNWQSISHHNYISFHSSFINMLLSLISSLEKPKITIAYNTHFIYEELKMLNPLVTFVFCNDIESYDNIDILLFEERNEDMSLFSGDKLPKITVEIHSRFLFRDQKKERPFSKEYLHFIYESPFAGQKIGVLASSFEISYPSPSFEEGIFYLEGSKYYHQLSKLSLPKFKHPKFISYEGYALCQEKLDTKFFQERGVYLRGQILYFSPLHTTHDIKRLQKSLDAYFS